METGKTPKKKKTVDVHSKHCEIPFRYSGYSQAQEKKYRRLNKSCVNFEKSSFLGNWKLGGGNKCEKKKK